MRIGVLGGTRFIGYHLVNALLRRGHQVSIFHRGRSVEPEPFEGNVERHVGDRRKPHTLIPFFRHDYDAVVDLSGYTPSDVASVIRWRSSIGHYLFCSTSSVYGNAPAAGFDERTPLAALPGTYGGDKASAERVLLERGEQASVPITVLRPQAVYGPHGARQALYVFTRVATGAPVLLRPKTVGKRINFLWVHDLVRTFVLAMRNPRTYGRCFNVAGNETWSSESFARLACRVSGHDHAPVVVLRTEVERAMPQIGLPWLTYDLIPDTTRVAQLGLRFSSLEQGLTELWSWARVAATRLDLSPQKWEQQAAAGRVPPRWLRGYWHARSTIRSKLSH